MKFFNYRDNHFFLSVYRLRQWNQFQFLSPQHECLIREFIIFIVTRLFSMSKLFTIIQCIFKTRPFEEKSVWLVLLVFIFPLHLNAHSVLDPDTLRETPTSNYYLVDYDDPALSDDKKNDHHLLAGAKLGVVFAFGVELNYIWRHYDRKITYLAASAQTSIIINSINGGGGFFLTKWGLGAGFRYHYLIRLYEEGEKVFLQGYAPEIVWYKQMGPQKNWYMNLKAGVVLNRDQPWPDISFGIFLPLSK